MDKYYLWPLRESFSALKNVDLILINGDKVPYFEKRLLKMNKNLKFIILIMNLSILNNLKTITF